MICAGGGGAPVVRNRLGELEGIEAVVDKDSTTGLLAEALDADMLVILTDVDAILTGKAGTIVSPSGTYRDPEGSRPSSRQPRP